MSPRRRDGLPNELGHGIYSERQRLVVLTFTTVEEAQAFDGLDDDEIRRRLAVVDDRELLP
jgi:hypothetical protein